MTAGQQYRALLIGVWSYVEGSDFDSLRGPPNDISELGRVLQDPIVGMFTVASLPNPTTGQLRTRVQKFLDQADNNDNLLLYYSGHGESSKESGQLCLTSVEAERSALDGASLAFNECYTWVRSSPARSVTVILDCCRSGIAFKGGVPDFDFAAYFDDGGEELASRRQPAKAIKVLTAGSGYENALDGLTDDAMSPFTARLRDAIESTAVADERGLVSLDAVVQAMLPGLEEKGPLPPTLGNRRRGRTTHSATRALHRSGDGSGRPT